MISLLSGTFVLSVIHGLIPNHWLPLVAVAKSENWPRKELLIIGLVTALAHVIGTIALGIILGLVGMRLSDTFETFTHYIAPVVLIVLGLIYFSLNMPHHHHGTDVDIKVYRKSKRRWILIFILLMFVSPCLEVETLFLSAGEFGLPFILLMALVYAIGSIASIVTLIYLAYSGSNLIYNDFIEHNEKKITGIVLIVIGLLTFFVH